MFIGGMYSLKGGREVIEQDFPELWQEVQTVISSIDSREHKTKTSAEVTMLGKELYSPTALNAAFKASFKELGWQNHKIFCDYSTEYYVSGYMPPTRLRRASRDIDFVKGKLGVEVQFGKYAFAVYNVCAKMTIFHNAEIINAGIEVVALKEFAKEMSTGVAIFEQFVWDLAQRGESDIDIPVLILGIAADRDST